LDLQIRSGFWTAGCLEKHFIVRVGEKYNTVQYTYMRASRLVFLANILAILSRRMVGGVTCHLFVRQEIEERLWWGEPEEETSSKAQTHIKDEGCNGCHGIRMKSVGWIGVPEDKEGDTG